MNTKEFTIVLSNPSRFDKENEKLLSGKAGAWMRYILLGKQLSEECNIIECSNGILKLPPSTKYCLLLGEQAGRLVLQEDFKGLNSNRGTIFKRGDITYQLTYQPQDAFDIKSDYEELNKSYYAAESSDEDENSSEEANEKDSTVTKRRNWKGWVTLDVGKFLTYIKEPSIDPAYSVKIRPALDEVIELLSTDEKLFVDIESDIDTDELTVIGLGFLPSGKVFTIPIYDYKNNLCYSIEDIARLYRALYLRFQKDVAVIAHNAMFDFFFLAAFYHIPPPKNIEDTMLIQHRIYPELEKSLGHCISRWTNLPYHKDEGIFNPNNSNQQDTFWKYNAKDVVATMAVYTKQQKFLSISKGHAASAKQVNSSIRAYINNALLGIEVDTDGITKVVADSSVAMEQYQRVINTLVGEDVKLLPSSSQSCAKYFHDILTYKVKKFNESGKPSVDEGSLWKIKLDHPLNIVIDFALRYRETQKVSSVGKVKLWQTPREQLLSKLLETESSTSQQVEETDQFQKTTVSQEQQSLVVTSQAGSTTDTSTETTQLSLIPSPETLESAINKDHLLWKRRSLQSLSELFPKKLETLKQSAKSKQKTLLQLLQSQQRMTTGWKLGGTNTFRLASSKLLGKWGTNLQNPNKKTLELFTSAPGTSLLQVDQAGAEALIVAYLCRDAKFRNLFRVGIKSHVYLALHLFIEDWKKLGATDAWLTMSFEDLLKEPLWKTVESAIKKDDLKYYMAKQTCHSANYQVGVNTFCLSMLKNSGGRVNISYADGKKLLTTYYRLFPEIPEWHKETDAFVEKHHSLKNLFGYPRQFFNAVMELDRDIYAFVPQSTVGTITNIAFGEVAAYIEFYALDWLLLNNKHDSLLLQVPDNDINHGALVLTHFIEKDLVGRDGVKFKMKSEASVGKNWGKYHKERNPYGMQDYSCKPDDTVHRTLSTMCF